MTNSGGNDFIDPCGGDCDIERIDKKTRSEWIEAMLRTTGIEQDYYRSKYHEPISNLPSKKNKEFAKALKDILS